MIVGHRARTTGLAVLALVATPAPFQQTPAFAGLYRMFQAGTEVGRETFRRTPDAAELSVVVPVLALKLDSRTVFDSTGTFQRFEAQAYDAAGDSLRGTYTVTVEGDTLHAVAVSKRTGASSTKAIVGPAAGVIPAQSVAVVALLAKRFAGHDTTVRMLPMGGDSTIPVTVAYHGDSATVAFAGIEARTSIAGGRPNTIEVPVQRVTAELWNGRDTLAALPGLHRPTPDYSAPPGAPYTAQEVRVLVHPAQGDTFSLAGTLTVPVAGAKPYPAVVTITGSGQQTRDEDLWPLLPDYRPFRQIAERLARVGVAVLRMDDRGVGGSGGQPGTTADYANDVRALVAWLRARPDIAAGKIFLLGHSEGGMIAPLVAATDPKLAGIVLLAGPSETGRTILTYQLSRPIETAPGLADSVRRAELAQVPARVQQFAQANAWTKWFIDYDPLPTARKVKVPVLILQGALDRQISAGQADTLAAAIRAAGNRDVTEKVFPGLNHLFLHTTGDGSPIEYPGLTDTQVGPEVLDEIATWVKAHS
jgi:alpha-beta hydrolase superfamily lysophospholipase